jgi:hypothetical protein
MTSKINLLLAFLFLIVLTFSGCLGSDKNAEITKTTETNEIAVINRNLINDNTIVGSWVQSSTGSKLVFLSNYSFVQILDNSYSNGAWRIENGNTLVLTMETWDYSQNIFGEYIGKEDVSFGTVSDGVLSFSSINDNPVTGFPSGDYLPEGAAISSGVSVSINDEATVGRWDNTRTNAELNFSSNHTFTFYANGQTENGTWRIEHGNVLVLNMRTYHHFGEYLGKEDVSQGTMIDGKLSLRSINNDFMTGFPTGDFVKI